MLTTGLPEATSRRTPTPSPARASQISECRFQIDFESAICNSQFAVGPWLVLPNLHRHHLDGIRRWGEGGEGWIDLPRQERRGRALPDVVSHDEQLRQPR